MAYGTTLVEHYKLDADTYHDYTIHTRKVRRVEERERWDHVEKIGWGSSGFVWLQEKTSMVEGHKEQRAVKVLEKGMMRQMGIDYMKELEALTEFRKPKVSNLSVHRNALIPWPMLLRATAHCASAMGVLQRVNDFGFPLTLNHRLRVPFLIIGWAKASSDLSNC